MKFARIVFFSAGAWGIVVLTPLYFMFDAIGRQTSSPITHPQFFYGFLSVAMAWQCAFFVIGSDPARFRLMMIPAVIEKLGHVVSMGVLYAQARISATDVMTAVPDLVLAVLFTITFATTRVARPASGRPAPQLEGQVVPALDRGTMREPS